MSELRGLVLAGPDPKTDKVVRWRCLDLREAFKKPARIGAPPVAVETGCAILSQRGAAGEFLVD